MRESLRIVKRANRFTRLSIQARLPVVKSRGGGPPSRHTVSGAIVVLELRRALLPGGRARFALVGHRHVETEWSGLVHRWSEDELPSVEGLGVAARCARLQPRMRIRPRNDVLVEPPLVPLRAEAVVQQLHLAAHRRPRRAAT